MRGQYTKTAAIIPDSFKEIAGDTPGMFEAMFSVFGNLDLDKDRVLQGALVDAAKDFPHMPMVWTHLWQIPPIGETIEWSEVKGGARAVGRLFVGESEDHQVARQVYAGLKAKALTQYSYSFDVPKDGAAENDEGGLDIAKAYPTYEWGPTLYGANPETSTLTDVKSLVSPEQIRKALGFKAIDVNGTEAWVPISTPEAKGVLPYRETEKADGAAAWDGAGEVARADTDDLRAMCAWYDANSPDAKDSYRLPHHSADSGHPVVLRGVQGAMASLLRDGGGIPEKDREAAYAHLAQHYEQFDKEPPAFKEYDAAQHRRAFPDEYPDLSQALELIWPTASAYSS